MKRPKTLREWVGLLVRSTRELRTTSAVIPAGTVFEVESSGRGLTVVGTTCSSCGFRPIVRQIRPEGSFDPIERIRPAPPPRRKR